MGRMKKMVLSAVVLLLHLPATFKVTGKYDPVFQKIRFDFWR